MFANELDLLKLRLVELWDIVDKFVMVEAREHHRGGPKPLFYTENKDQFAEWSSKIDVVVIDSFGLDGDAVKINSQREQIARRALDKYPFEPNSTILYSDADEIIRPSVVRAYLQGHPGDLNICGVRFYQYFFNCQVCPVPEGARPVIGSSELFKQIGFEAARWQRGFSPTMTDPIIPDAAWHFAYLGNLDALKEKISWAVEGGCSDWVFKEDPLLIQSRIDQGLLYNGAKQFSFVAIDETMPQYVRDNAETLTRKGLIKPL